MKRKKSGTHLFSLVVNEIIITYFFVSVVVKVKFDKCTVCNKHGRCNFDGGTAIKRHVCY